MVEKRPAITYKIINDTICSMTGLDLGTVDLITSTYQELMYKTLLEGIEFPLKYIGTLGFNSYQPRPAGMYYNTYHRCREEYPARPGYLRLTVKTGGRFKKKLKANTLFGEGMRGEEWRNWLNEKYKDAWGHEAHPWKNDDDDLDDNVQDEDGVSE